MKAIYQPNGRERHTVNFDAATEQSMKEIHSALCCRWRLRDKPSISLLLAGVVREFADCMKDDPNALASLMSEIKARGGAVTKYRAQFRPNE